jgi:hypothetical protein
MDKLKRVLSGDDEDEDRGIVTQVGSACLEFGKEQTTFHRIISWCL